MSLMKTLAKVAVGVAVAKGAQSMMRNAGTSGGSGGLGAMLSQMTGSSGAQGGIADALSGLTGALGGTSSGATHAGGGAGGLEQMLGSLLGGGAQGGPVQSGGLGGLLDSLGGGAGLQSMLGGLAGAGGLGAVLGGLADKAASRQGSNDTPFSAVLNSQFDETPEPALEPSPDQEALAALMLRAMIQATKADGALDDAEQAKLVDRLGGDVDAEEAAFVRAELARPMDVDGLVADTPSALAPQVYAMSVLGIDLDSQAEAQYLHKLAQGFGLDSGTVNEIHAELGVPSLYA